MLRRGSGGGGRGKGEGARAGRRGPILRPSVQPGKAWAEGAKSLARCERHASRIAANRDGAAERRRGCSGHRARRFGRDRNGAFAAGFEAPMTKPFDRGSVVTESAISPSLRAGSVRARPAEVHDEPALTTRGTIFPAALARVRTLRDGGLGRTAYRRSAGEHAEGIGCRARLVAPIVAAGERHIAGRVHARLDRVAIATGRTRSAVVVAPREAHGLQ
jgi:hypothetical protein